MIEAFVIIIIGFVIYCIIASQWEQKQLKVESYIIETNKIPKGKEFRFVFLTDLHNASFGKGNEKLIKCVEEINPQAVLLGGDMLIGTQQPQWENAVACLDGLSKRFPIYYGMGNHEYRMKIWPEDYGNTYDTYCKLLQQNDLHIMANETVIWDEQLLIHGLEIEVEYYQRFKKVQMHEKQMEQYLGTCDETRFNLVIAHNPAFFESYANWGADLVLAGHNHGGIVQLPILGGVISTQFTLFPKYDSGLFTHKKSKMVLSRGLGMHTIPFRLWNKPEVSLITIKGR